MVLVVVVVVDVYMGRVKKKLLITLPTLLHGVSIVFFINRQPYVRPRKMAPGVGARFSGWGGL